MDECDVCQEFSTGICEILTPPQSRILYDSKDTVITPALGSFIEGYVIIWSRQHYPSMGVEGLRSLADLLPMIRQVITDAYTAPVIFEHGATTNSGRGGACIDHAHLHVVACSVDLLPRLQEVGPTRTLAGWQNLDRFCDRPYLLYGPSDSEMLYICEKPSIRSQYLRKALAEATGHQDSWDWLAYLGIAEMMRTYDKLKPIIKARGR